MSFFDQTDYLVRFEWGADGFEALAPSSDITIIGDVLRFSTRVNVTVGRDDIVAHLYLFLGDADRIERSIDGDVSKLVETLECRSYSSLIMYRFRYSGESRISVQPAAYTQISRCLFLE